MTERIGFIWLKIASGPVAGNCEFGGDLSGSIKRKHCSMLRDDPHVLWNNFAPWSLLGNIPRIYIEMAENKSNLQLSVI
jgi:hypothetical protein